MIELLELSEVLKAVERTGTEVRYYDQLRYIKSCGLVQTQCQTIVSLFVHATTLITVIYLTLLGMKLFTWYKLADGGPVQDRDRYYDREHTTDIKDRVFNDYPEHMLIEASN